MLVIDSDGNWQGNRARKWVIDECGEYVHATVEEPIDEEVKKDEESPVYVQARAQKVACPLQPHYHTSPISRLCSRTSVSPL